MTTSAIPTAANPTAATPDYENYSARILADSVSEDGSRMTTFEITFFRGVLAEVNTHKMLSKNAGSSRARPIEKVINSLKAQTRDQLPIVHWGRNQAGMQAWKELEGSEKEQAQLLWEAARNNAVMYAEMMLAIGEPDENNKRGLHKQATNRILENFGYVTLVLSGTDFSNFFALRTDENAQPEIRKIASMMLDEYNASKPELLREGEWHLPLIYAEDRALAQEQYPEDPDVLLRVSTGRCARVSYLTHDGKRDLSKDLELHDQLVESGHMSPAEHVARPMTKTELAMITAAKEAIQRVADTEGVEAPDWMLRQLGYSANLHGWVSYRKSIRHEHDFALLLAEQEV